MSSSFVQWKFVPGLWNRWKRCKETWEMKKKNCILRPKRVPRSWTLTNYLLDFFFFILNGQVVRCVLESSCWCFLPTLRAMTWEGFFSHVHCSCIIKKNVVREDEDRGELFSTGWIAKSVLSHGLYNTISLERKREREREREREIEGRHPG